MAALSDYLEDALLKELFRNTNYAPPTQVWVALYTADPADSNISANEVSSVGTGYTRMRVYTDGVTAPFWTAPANEAGGGKECTNSATFDFPEALLDWGIVTHAALMDAATAGNQLMHQALPASRDVKAGDVFRVKAGELKARLK